MSIEQVTCSKGLFVILMLTISVMMMMLSSMLSSWAMAVVADPAYEIEHLTSSLALH
jgi:hypothetical protein